MSKKAEATHNYSATIFQQQNKKVALTCVFPE